MDKQYYEAIVQVRPGKRSVEWYIESAIKNADKVSLARKKWLKTGTDYYITSWKFSVSLGNALVKLFGGSINVSKKLFGKNREGKIVYRCTVLYKPPLFEQGDIVASGSKVLRVTSLGKVVWGKNLLTGKKEALDSKADWQKLKKYKVVVSRSQPHMEVISPEDYQSVKVENAGKTSERNSVKVVMYEGKAYLVG